MEGKTNDGDISLDVTGLCGYNPLAQHTLKIDDKHHARILVPDWAWEPVSPQPGNSAPVSWRMLGG